MRCAIPGLRKFLDCAEHIYWHRMDLTLVGSSPSTGRCTGATRKFSSSACTLPSLSSGHFPSGSPHRHWRYYGGAEGGVRPPKPPGELRVGRLAWSRGGRHAMLTLSTRPQLASKVRRSDTLKTERSPLIQSKEQQPRSSLIQLKEQQPRNPR